MPDLYAGLMSGTSMDGVDAVLIEDRAGFPCIACAHGQYPADLQQLLQQIVGEGRVVGLKALLEADQRVAGAFLDAASKLLSGVEPELRARVRAIGMHGQTVFHAPEIGQTLQLGNPSRLAAEFGIPVVADLRRADLAAGGQGAPLAPAFHAQAFRSTRESRVILNLGGIANITCLPADEALPVTGFDTGPANTLMDTWTQARRDQPYDDGGHWARSGRCDEQLLQLLLQDPYFAQAAPKSTGREYFRPEWLRPALQQFPQLTAADVQATLCELTVHSIADAIAHYAPEANAVYVCGGGWHNSYLIERLRAVLPQLAVRPTSELGIEPQLVEAAAFAWIARQHMHGEPANLPSVTGAHRPVILGALYPANPV